MNCPECLIEMDLVTCGGGPECTSCNTVFEEKDYYYQCKKCKRVEDYETEVPLSMPEIRKLRKLIELNEAEIHSPLFPYIIGPIVDGPIENTPDFDIIWSGTCVDCKINEGKIIRTTTAPCLCDGCRAIREKNGDDF